VFNFEAKSSYAIRVRTTNSLGQYYEGLFSINVTNVNETPASISLSNNSINEGSSQYTTIGTFSTTDPDASNTFTYTLVAGTGSGDNSSFDISGSSLRNAVFVDYETKSTYSIRVRSTDQGGLYVESQFTIYINDVNETPIDINLSNASQNENTSTNTTIGTFSTSDQDAGNTFTYTLVAGTGSDDNSSFNISGNALRNSIVFDYESKTSYWIRVRSTDQGGLYNEKQFTIYVNNVNESPTDITLSNSSQNENTSTNTTIGTFSTSDPDAGNSFTYTLVAGTGSGDNGSFNISGSSLRNSVVFDYETKSSYSIRVRSTDQGGLYTEKQFTISVNNVAEPTYAITSSAYTVAEGDTITLTVNTTDIGNGTSLGWYVGYNGTTSSADFSSATSGNVTINSNTGTFTLTISSDGLSEGSESFYVVLNSTGGSAAATTTDITILSYPIFNLGTTQPNCVTNGTSTTGKLLITGGNPGDFYRYCGSATFSCTNNGCTSPDGTINGSGNATIDTGYINGLGGSQTYTVRVYNASPNCNTSVYTDKTVTLYESICITATVTTSNVLCNGGNGSITITNVTGGSGGTFQTKLSSVYTTYTNWTSSTTYNVPAGTYTVYIKDSAGKVEEYSRTITQPSALGIFAQKTGADQIYASVSGGAAGTKTFELYQDFTSPYEIGGGSVVDTLYDSSNVTFNSLAAGYYYVKATDGNGCSETTSYIITV
jgi:mRNA-degrading endonuclease HigB of HigAB toxin-antitoxin module